MDRTNRMLLAGVLGWAALLIFVRLPLPLLEPEETRYAEIPREMLAADQWLVPVFQGQTYLDKPPLLYWLVMGSYRLFGEHVWSARLVSAVTAWLTVVVVYLWGRRVFEERTGLFAALVLTLSGDFVYRAPMLTMNGPLALFTALGLCLGHVAGLGPKFDRRAWLLAGLATAAGVLMKGPVAIVLVVGPLLGVRWMPFDTRRNLSPWAEFVLELHPKPARTSFAARHRSMPALFDWLGFAAVVALVAGPWFLWMAWTEPTFVDYFFFKHHVERYVAPFDHVKPFWFYLPQVVFGLLPWSLFLAGRIDRVWRSSTSRWLLVAGLGGLIFFSLAGSKRPVYLVPIYAPLALAVADLLRTEPRRAFLPVAGATAVVLALLTFVGLPIYSDLHSRPTPEVRVAD